MAHPPPLPSSLTITPTANLVSLKNISNILHLFAHRNHNQHRRSPWYRHFDSFRRQLARLIAELSLCASGASTSKSSTLHPEIPPPHLPSATIRTKEATLRVVEAASKQRQRVDEARLRAEKRIVFWREQLVWRWWKAFGMVVGDVQFAQLGLVLLACLGEVCSVLGILVGMGVERDREPSDVLNTAREEKMDLGVGFGDEGVDIGVSVERRSEGEPELVEEEERYTSSILGGQKAEFTHEEKQGRKRSLPEAFKKSTSAARNRKRKKPVDAIDELFSGLV